MTVDRIEPGTAADPFDRNTACFPKWVQKFDWLVDGSGRMSLRGFWTRGVWVLMALIMLDLLLALCGETYPSVRAATPLPGNILAWISLAIIRQRAHDHGIRLLAVIITTVVAASSTSIVLGPGNPSLAPLAILLGAIAASGAAFLSGVFGCKPNWQSLLFKIFRLLLIACTLALLTAIRADSHAEAHALLDKVSTCLAYVGMIGGGGLSAYYWFRIVACPGDQTVNAYGPVSESSIPR